MCLCSWCPRGDSRKRTSQPRNEQIGKFWVKRSAMKETKWDAELVSEVLKRAGQALWNWASPRQSGACGYHDNKPVLSGQTPSMQWWAYDQWRMWINGWRTPHVHCLPNFGLWNRKNWYQTQLKKKKKYINWTMAWVRKNAHPTLTFPLLPSFGISLLWIVSWNSHSKCWEEGTRDSDVVPGTLCHLILIGLNLVRFSDSPQVTMLVTNPSLLPFSSGLLAQPHGSWALLFVHKWQQAVHSML